MKFKLLNQYHVDYDHAKMDKLEALYEGGDYLMTHLPLFIPQKPNEHPQVYADRIACASYINYMAEIIDYYTSNLFSKPLALIPAADASNPNTMGDDIKAPEFYQQFSADADLCGNAFSTVMQKVLTDALTYGCGYVGVDFPLTDVPATLQEEELIGADRAYLYCIDPETLINYACDDFGSFKWAVLKKCYIPQDDPFSERDKKVIQFKVWSLEGEYAKWQLFELEVKPNKEPRDNDDVPLVAEGYTSFRQIPIVALEMEKGLWIGNKIGNLCADHLRLRTALIHSENRSLYAAPFFKQGEETLDGPGDDTHRGRKAANVFANKGFMVLGANDEVGFMEPEGKAYQLIDNQLKELADEIHRVVHQMANSIVASTQSLARSAASKLMDNQATEIILSEYGDLTKEFAKRVYTCVSEARNENIVWNAIGLSNYKIIDKDQLSKEALIVNNQLNIPSKTFEKVYLTHLADSFAPTISPETQLIIKREIEDAVDAGETEPQVGADGQPVANEPGQSNTLPKPAKKAAQPKADPANSEDDSGIELSENGHEKASPYLHMRAQESTSGIADRVYAQLEEDYSEDLIQWVRAAHWSGPLEISMNQIDDSNMANWDAVKNPARQAQIKEFERMMSDSNSNKPIVLVNLPDDSKLQIVDGHGRFTAAKNIGKETITAFIAEVGSMKGQWDTMHKLERQGEAGGKSMQMSSIQKDK